MRRLGHNPALDGIRGIAWVVVFVAHAWVIRALAMGQVAMFVFFALSGFLITQLLLEERERADRVSLRNFFARRGLRLLPALVAFLLVWMLVVLATRGHAPWTTTVPGGSTGSGTSPLVALEGLGSGLGYLTNWLITFHLFSGYLPIGHLWSLAVEEQFYVLWAPLVVAVLALRGRRGVVLAAGIGAVASFLDVALLRAPGGLSLSLGMATDARAGSFLVGAFLAAGWSGRWQVIELVGRRYRILTTMASLAVMGWAGWAFDHPVSPRTFDLAWIGVSVASGFLVLAVVNGGRIAKGGFLAGGLWTYLGRRSYALYLWHYVWLTWLHGFGLLGIGLAFGASLATAELSWQLVERRALALKGRFGPATPRTTEPPARAPGRAVNPAPYAPALAAAPGLSGAGVERRGPR